MLIDRDVLNKLFQPALTLSALLAGFSFTAVLILVMSEKSGVIIDVILTSFTISTAAFIILSLNSVLIIEGVISKKNIEKHIKYFINFGASFLLLGFVAFTIGFGMSGFIYAKWLGAISLACAVGAFILFLFLSVKLQSFD